MANKTPCHVLRHVLARFIFLSHGILTFAIYFNNTHKHVNWCLAIPLVLLFFDIIIRKEFKYFWISAFLYIASLLPIIWLVEIDLLNTRLETLKRFNITIDDEGTGYEHDNLPLVPIPSRRQRNAKSLFNLDFLNLSNDIVAKKLCNIGIVVGIILGRAMMPRGQLTHDKLSSMLLTFVSNSADIIGLFDTFVNPSIMYHDTIIYLVLGIFSWSMYQFTFIPSDYEGNRAEPVMIHYVGNPITRENSKTDSVLTQDTSDHTLIDTKEIRRPPYLDHPTSTFNQIRPSKSKSSDCNVDVCESLILLLMHDGPYLLLRMFLIFYHQVTTEMHIFFTIKNGIVVVLHLYRMCSLCCSRESEKKKTFEITAERRYSVL